MSFMPTLMARLNKATAAPKSRFNRTSLAAAFVFACMSQNVFALGLGEIEVSSVINEPLAASIPVLNADGIEQAELIVALGSATDYQIAGVTWDFSHSELQFDVGYAANGDLMVNVSSTRAIREPYLNLLVQARWPAGRLLREYTILLDFPVFTGEQNSAPVARASAPAPVAVTPAPVAAPRPAPVVAQPNPAPRLVSVAPAADSPQPLGEDDYRIQNGDTLWSLGGRVAQDLGVSRHQAMLAIQEANPEAFTQGNLNMMRSGSVIRVPTRTAALSRSATQAASEFAQAMSDSGQIADATPLQSRATDFRDEAGSDQSGDAQFRLTSAEQANAAVAGSGVDQIIEENQLLSDINAALEEELQAASIENRDLSGRLQNLEEQITVMEALIEVENSEIRAVQEAVTSTQPVVNTITTADVQEEGLVSKLLGVLPIVGLVVIGLLAGAYLVIRRRKSGDHAGDIAGFDEEYDEDAPIFAEQPSSEESVETAEPEPEPQAEPEEPVDDDLENLAADMPDDSAVEDIEMPVDTPDEEQLSTDVNDQEEATAEPEASAPAEEEEEWASDFDDLDAFFDDVDDTASPETKSEPEAEAEAVVPEPSEETEETIEETEDEESESEKTQIFDASMLAGANLDDSEPESEPESEPDEENAEEPQEAEADADTDDENSDEQLMDFSLDEDDLTTEEPEQEASQDPEGDEFSLDFDLDGDDLEAEAPEAEPEADEVDPEEDENMVAFDVSDEDLPSESEESEQQEETEAAEPEPEPEPEPESEDSSDSDELDLSDLGLDDEASEDSEDSGDSDDDLDALLDQLDDDTDGDAVDSEDAEAADTTDADAAADEDLDIDLDGDLDDLSALLDEADDSSADSETEPLAEEEPSADQEPSAEQEPSADQEPSAEQEQPATEDSEDTDELLGDFGDDDLDLSDVSGGGDVAEECETKLELAAAYIEMGDNSGAKELLDEVIREGDESFQARANELIEKMG